MIHCIVQCHYSDVTLSVLVSQITGDSTVCLSVCLHEYQRKHNIPCYGPFVRQIRQWLVSPVTGVFPSQRASFVGIVSIWWRHHAVKSQFCTSLRWRHNDHAGVSNHQPHGCLLNRLFRRKSKKTSKLRVTGLCAGNSPWTGEFPAQMASFAENVSIWRRHHDITTVKLSWHE